MRLRRGYKIALSIIAGVLVTIITVPFWIFFLALGVSGEIYPGMLNYWLLIPDSLHQLPMDHCTRPVYYQDMTSGHISLVASRRCHTSDPDLAFDYYWELFLKRGYEASEQSFSLNHNKHA